MPQCSGAIPSLARVFLRWCRGQFPGRCGAPTHGASAALPAARPLIQGHGLHNGKASGIVWSDLPLPRLVMLHAPPVEFRRIALGRRGVLRRVHAGCKLHTNINVLVRQSITSRIYQENVDQESSSFSFSVTKFWYISSIGNTVDFIPHANSKCTNVGLLLIYCVFLVVSGLLFHIIPHMRLET